MHSHEHLCWKIIHESLEMPWGCTGGLRRHSVELRFARLDRLPLIRDFQLDSECIEISYTVDLR
jgi:predicted metallopeptidase